MKKYYILQPSAFKLDGGAMFGIIPKPLWSQKIPADDLNRIELSLRLLLIQTQKRWILIDTGIGDYHGKKFDQRFGVTNSSAPLISLLEDSMKISPSDITDVILSHLHFDHVGGLGTMIQDKFESHFPKARLHLHKKHYQYALHPTVRDAGSFEENYFKDIIEKADSQGLVHWLTDEEGPLIEDDDIHLFYKCSHGHTPWMIHPYDERFIYMADLVPTLSHIPLAWVMGYDISPGKTTTDKSSFYEFISKNELTMIFEHDRHYWGAKIKDHQELHSQVSLQKRFEVIESFKTHEASWKNSFCSPELKVLEIFAD